MTRGPANLAASVRARLRNRARSQGEDFQLVLQRYAAERFLYRLGQSPHRERLVLKGAMLFALWGGPAYRATRDLDLAGFGPRSEAALTRAIREICSVPCPVDGITFQSDTLRAEPIRDDSEYAGLRLRLEASLEQARIRFQIDVGFGDAIEPGPSAETYPTLLDGTPPPQIRAYPREAVVAEKLHALVVFGSANTRMKDFYDLFVLAHCFPFSGASLGRSIGATFQRRTTPIPRELPAGLGTAFYADAAKADQWRRYLDRSQLPRAPADFSRIGEALRSFLEPPLLALRQGVEFDREWPQGGPWR